MNFYKLTPLFEFAATVVEFEPKEGEHVCACEAVNKLPGILRVRVIK